MSHSVESLPEWARGLLEESRVARLGLLDTEDSPRVMPITFAIHAGVVWTVIDGKPKRHPERDPARIRYLRRSPRVALTVDRYSGDWSELAWVQLLGRATVIEAGEGSEAVAALAARYEQYVAEPPPGPLIRIAVDRALSWRAADG